MQSNCDRKITYYVSTSSNICHYSVVQSEIIKYLKENILPVCGLGFPRVEGDEDDADQDDFEDEFQIKNSKPAVLGHQQVDLNSVNFITKLMVFVFPII